MNEPVVSSPDDFLRSFHAFFLVPASQNDSGPARCQGVSRGASDPRIGASHHVSPAEQILCAFVLRAAKERSTDKFRHASHSHGRAANEKHFRLHCLEVKIKVNGEGE